MKKFNIKTIEKELLEINQENKIKSKAAVQLVVNSLLIYNQLLDDYNNGKQNNLYLLYQMSSTVFKMLKEYKIIPSTVEDNKEETDSFNEFVNTFKKKKIEVRN